MQLMKAEIRSNHVKRVRERERERERERVTLGSFNCVQVKLVDFPN